MNRRNLYKTVFTIASVIVLSIAGFSQGKGHGGGNPHGGGGNPHGGGGNPRGGGQPQQRQAPPPQQRGGGNPHGNGGNHGNGGGQQRQVWAQRMQQQRAVQQQMRQQRQPQQRVVQQPQQRGNGRGGWMQQMQQQRAAQPQQRAIPQPRQNQQPRGNDRAGWFQQRQDQPQQRQNQRQSQQDLRRQPQQNPREWRQNQQALRQQFQRNYVPPQQPVFNGRGNNGHDNGKHNGWTDNGPRGNAYGLRGMAPGQNRQAFNNWSNAPLWQSQQMWQQRQAERGDRGRDFDRQRRNSATYYYNNAPQVTYYNYDPYAAWAPRIYRVYDYNGYTPSYGYDPYGYSYNSYDPYDYGYGPSYYADPRDTFVRTLISSFFVPDQYDYTTFYTPPYYDNPYYSYSDPGYYYSETGYYPSYYNAGYYDNGYSNYDPYYYSGVPMFASPFYGDNSLKSSLLNFGVQLLQGMLGQGYNQGLNDAEYVRVEQGPVYYDPYQAPEPAYYSPYVSSFADQRQIFENGYRMGYEDAMRQQDPYGVYNNGNARVDVVSQFLANSFLGS